MSRTIKPESLDLCFCPALPLFTTPISSLLSHPKHHTIASVTDCHSRSSVRLRSRSSMASSATLLDLPSELLLTILQPLPLYDCSQLVKALPHPKIRACYNTRSSIREYLSQRGLPAAELIAALDASDVLMLGGLVTEYFTHSSSKSDSKWIFLIPADRGKRYHFMKFMESCGVRWCSLHEGLVFSQSHTGRFTMRRSHFCRAALSSLDSNLRLSGVEFSQSPAPTVLHHRRWRSTHVLSVG